MILSDDQARKWIKAPKSKADIDSVKDLESSLRIFTEEMSQTELTKEQAWTALLKAMKARSAKKFDRVFQFSRYPLPIVQITDSILNDFFKVYEGKNRYFNVDAPTNIDALRNWLIDLDLVQWVEKQSMKVFRNEPSNIVVVDRAEDGTPYPIAVTTDRLIDACVKTETGQLDYIIFIHSKEHISDTEEITRYAVYDDMFYRVYEHNNKTGIYTLVIENAHDLGYCPAHMFVFEKANSQNWLKRRTPFGQSLTKMQDWTIFDIFRNYVDHYAPFPITESPISKCANQNCHNGKIKDEQVINEETGESRIIWKNCEVCGGKDKMDLMGPGTHIGIKVQADKNIEDGSGKFKMHFPETDKMKYVPEKLDSIERELRYKTVGISNMLTVQAINELQAKGSFASMDNILLRTKTNLDYIYKWIVITAGKLVFPNVEIFVEANFGTEWYLVSEEQLQKRFEEAKRIGLPKYEQAAIYDQIIETKYKGNSTKIERQKLLFMLEPLPLYTEAEAVDLFEKGVITREELNLKLNFYNFIQRFESEQAPVIEFGSNLQMPQRLVRIMNVLDGYNTESLAQFQTPPVPTTGTGVNT